MGMGAPNRQQLDSVAGLTKKPRLSGVFLNQSVGRYYFFLEATASLRALPGRNLGTLAAAILISLPVCGLRPVRALRVETSKLPKPTSVTLSPFLSASVTAEMNPPTAFSAEALVRAADLATASMSSALVMLALLLKS